MIIKISMNEVFRTKSEDKPLVVAGESFALNDILRAMAIDKLYSNTLLILIWYGWK